MLEAKKILRAWHDITHGLCLYEIWWGLAWLEIKQRYSRSIIGPFWIMLSMAIMIGSMGPLYGTLFGLKISNYIQYLAVSLIIWNFISTCINESGGTFTTSEIYIKQLSLPFSIYVYKLILRNLFILSHTAVICILIMILVPPQNFYMIFLLPIGLVLVVGNLLWISFLFGIFSTRFRDLPQIITNLMQVMFFLSPILWTIEMLPDSRKFYAVINPFYHFVEVIRSPLLGHSISTISWITCFVLLILGNVVSFFIFSRYRARIPYWI